MGRLSLSRVGSPEYQGYLASVAWNRRRWAWFRSVRARGFEPACQVCLTRLDVVGSLDVHHVNYEGVVRLSSGEWVAGERDEDLMALCRGHHVLVHRALDRGREFLGWNRKTATVVVVAGLRSQWQGWSQEAQAGWVDAHMVRGCRDV